MPILLVQVDRFVDEYRQGFVECSLVDASGRTHLFAEKVPIVSAEGLWSHSQYHRPGFIECKLERELKSSGGEVFVQVSAERPWDVESTAGETQFVVHSRQVRRKRAA